MKIKHFSQRYLNFTSSQKAGVAVVLFVILVLYFIPDLIYSYKVKRENFKITYSKSDSLNTIIKNKEFNIKKYEKKKHEFSPFYFDPNTVNPDNLRSFGLPNYVINNFVKYRKSGAVFKNKNDFKKIYGLKPEWYEKIEPYIKIDEVKENAEKFKSEKYTEKFEKLTVEINSTDSSTLINVKGIGPYLASKIIKYRDALGGFVSPEQLYEIFNIKKEMVDVFVSALTFDVSLIKKININTATFEKLKNHPYINSRDAIAIINYRKQHGLYENTEDLKKILILKPETIEKIKPYLEY